MLYVKRQQQERFIPGILLSFLILSAVLLLFICSVHTIHSRTADNRLNALSHAIKRASVQCYAIEGRYPPSVEYLEERYGILINHRNYHIFYDGWASNIMPDITVLPKETNNQKEEAH